MHLTFASAIVGHSASSHWEIGQLENAKASSDVLVFASCSKVHFWQIFKDNKCYVALVWIILHAIITETIFKDSVLACLTL